MAQSAEPHSCVLRAEEGRRQKMTPQATTIYRPPSPTSLRVEHQVDRTTQYNQTCDPRSMIVRHESIGVLTGCLQLSIRPQGQAQHQNTYNLKVLHLDSTAIVSRM
jgi:hypothetical protein